jgi:hypothetical protein
LLPTVVTREVAVIDVDNLRSEYTILSGNIAACGAPFHHHLNGALIAYVENIAHLELHIWAFVVAS